MSNLVVNPAIDVFYICEEHCHAAFRSLMGEHIVEVHNPSRFEKTLYQIRYSKIGGEMRELLKKTGFLYTPKNRPPKLQRAPKARGKISVISFEAEGKKIVQSLKSCGFNSFYVPLSDFKGIETELVVCALNSSFAEECEKVGRYFLERNIPVLFVLFDCCFGPFVDGPPCFSCFLKRAKGAWKENPTKEDYIIVGDRKKYFPPANLSRSIETIVEEAQRFFSGEIPRLRGCVEDLSGNLYRVVEHEVCGHSERKKFELKSRKVVSKDNGYRAFRVEHTLAEAEKFIGKFGVITEEAPFFEGKKLIASWALLSESAQPSLLRLISNGYRMRLRRTSGKGTTGKQLRASALLEGFERYCAKFSGREEIIVAPYNSIKESAVAPRSLFLARDQMDLFDEEEPIEWVRGWSLTKKKEVLVPAVSVFLLFKSRASKFPSISSNGLSSGNCMEEAVLHGICEVIERDSNYIVWKNRMKMPDLEVPRKLLSNFDEIKNFLEGRISGKISINFKDYTTDLGIPAIMAHLSTEKSKFGHPLHSMAVGAHPDPQVALSRAVTEAFQVFPWYTVQYNTPVEHTTRGKWYQELDISFLDKGEIKKSFGELPNLASDDLLENIRTCVSLLKKKGYETIVVDLSKPPIPFPVIRVIVPGLQPVERRLSFPRISERCKEMPKRLGIPGKLT
ncbi:MAG: hypothetical protein DRI61_11270, partial [Chloroflexi bacterium]